MEWIIFRIEKVKTGPIFLVPEKTDVIPILNNYNIKVVRVAKFSDHNHHLRNSTRANRNVLKEKNVAMLGCGSLGSEIADCLCKAGINQIRLIDFLIH